MQLFITRDDLDTFLLRRLEIESLKRKKIGDYLPPDPPRLFAKQVGDGLVDLLKGQSLCLIAILPDGPYYAEPLKRYLTLKLKDRGTTCITVDINDIAHNLKEKRDKIHGRKLLLVDNATHTGESYGTIARMLFQLGGCNRTSEDGDTTTSRHASELQASPHKVHSSRWRSAHLCDSYGKQEYDICRKSIRQI